MSWAIEHGRELLDAAGQAGVRFLGCLGLTTVAFLTLVHLLLFKRFLQIRFGKRIQPDGSRAVIITGATSGFGLATAKRLYARGFSVFACYYNHQEAGYKELLGIKLAGSPTDESEDSKQIQMVSQKHLFLVRMDVRSSESIETSAQEILKLMEAHDLQLHCLLNNAGICADGPFEFSSSQSIRNLLDTNVAGVYQVTKEFILRIIKDKGRVVNVSSGVSLYPGRTISLYGSSKAAVRYFSMALNEDLKPYGATCCTIVPGNFLLQSNIIFTRIGFIQNAIAKLSYEEREVYWDKIEDTTESLYGLLKVRLAHSKEDPRELAELYRIELPDFGTLGGSNKSRKRPTLWQRFLTRWMRSNDGSVSGQVDLERSGAIDCFESAVTLCNPPPVTYAGNCSYQYHAAPLSDYLPLFVLNSLGEPLVSGLFLSK